MAETGFWLKGAKGQLAGTVMYTTGGRTLQRQIVTPKNPQSDNQMRQRAAFAGASKFYQNAQQNRFVLAFQNKKGNQSEFNAFMQKNLREFDTLTYPTKEQANTPEFCNFFPWICTEGNLQSIPVAYPDDGLGAWGCAIKTDTSEGYAQNWDELIALNPKLNLQYGDIITLTVVLSDEVFDDVSTNVVIGSLAPVWVTRQFIIGADLDGYSLEQYLNINGMSLGALTAIDGDTCLGIDMNSLAEEYGITQGEFSFDENAAMLCVTRSRRDGSQTKVSSSRFYLTDMAQRIFERLSNDSAMRDAIESYKKSANSNITPANILQGSVAEEIPVSDLYYRNSSGDTVHASAPITGVSAEAVTSSGNSVAEFTVLGTASGEDVNPANVSATASGYTVEIVSTKKRVQGPHTMSLYEGAKITFTKTGTTAGSTPFSISYKGVKVASGNIVVSA